MVVPSNTHMLPSTSHQQVATIATTTATVPASLSMSGIPLIHVASVGTSNHIPLATISPTATSAAASIPYNNGPPHAASPR
jgi:hypothetical protein